MKDPYKSSVKKEPCLVTSKYKSEWRPSRAHHM